LIDLLRPAFGSFRMHLQHEDGSLERTLSERADRGVQQAVSNHYNIPTTSDKILPFCTLPLLLVPFLCSRKRLHVGLDVLIHIGLSGLRLGRQIVDGATQRVVLLDKMIAECM
jgi:hypothetical protein